MQQRTLDRVRKLNGCASEGEGRAEGCTRYPSQGGTPVVVFLHDEGHRYPAAAPALIGRCFQEQAKKERPGARHKTAWVS